MFWNDILYNESQDGVQPVHLRFSKRKMVEISTMLSDAAHNLFGCARVSTSATAAWVPGGRAPRYLHRKLLLCVAFESLVETATTSRCEEIAQLCRVNLILGIHQTSYNTVLKHLVKLWIIQAYILLYIISELRMVYRQY